MFNSKQQAVWTTHFHSILLSLSLEVIDSEFRIPGTRVASTVFLSLFPLAPSEARWPFFVLCKAGEGIGRSSRCRQGHPVSGRSVQGFNECESSAMGAGSGLKPGPSK